MENITIRRKLRKTNSDINLSNRNNTIYNSTFLDDTVHSLPADTDINNISSIEELKSQIEDLTTELVSAHKEIENQTYEINNLKKIISEQTMQINFLKKISSQQTTPRKFFINNSPRNVQNTKRSTIANPSVATQNSPVVYNQKETDTSFNAQKSQQLFSLRDENEINICDTNTPTKNAQQTVEINNTTTKIKTKPKIMILGDEQIRGLAANIIESKYNKRRNDYIVTSFVKPQADSTYILNSSKSIISSLNEKDIIILGMGSHDKSPYTLYSTLSSFIQILQQKNVDIYVIQVQKNLHLDTRRLNQTIKKQLHENHKKFTYLDTGYLNHNQKLIIKKLSFKLLVELEYLRITTKKESTFIQNNLNYKKDNYLTKILTNNKINNELNRPIQDEINSLSSDDNKNHESFFRE